MWFSVVDAVASMVDSAVDAWVKPTLFTTMEQWSFLVADNVIPQVHVCPYLPLLTQRHLTKPHVPPLVPLLKHGEFSSPNTYRNRVPNIKL